MSELGFHTGLLWTFFVLSALLVPTLLFVSAPYGRHVRGGWGPTIPNTVGWIVMELPAVVTMAVMFVLGRGWEHTTQIAFLAIWEWHYIQRTFVFPFRLRSSGKRMPLMVALMAVVFNVANGYLIGRWLFGLGPARPDAWLGDPRFLLGVCVFLAGWVINIQSDTILIHLRKPGETGYKVPHGGLYRFVTCPNYLGELIEWLGFALLTWCLPALAFAAWTAGNLVPRAVEHHRWYRERFEGYPPQRRAILPFIL